MKKLITILFIFSYSNMAFSILPFEDATSPELVTSARALAMGNSYMSKVDDSWSHFYNPAGFGTVRGFRSHLGNIHLEMNNGFLDITGGSGAFTDSLSKYSDAFKPIGLRSLHADNPGNISHAKFQVYPNMTFRYFSIGWMYAQQNRARLASATADFEISERVDYGPVLGVSYPMFGGVLKFGVSAVLLTRKQLQKDFAPTDPIVIDKSVDYRKGTMTHVTAGMRITLPVAFLPTFSLVSRNSSDTEWNTPEYGGAPDVIPQTTDASFSITPNLGRTSRLHFEVGYKDIGDEYDTVPQARKIMGGIELDFYRKMFVRFGYGDGWGSGGIGVRSKSFVFDLTSYAIEASPDKFREDEDRRYALSMSGGF